MKKEDSHSQNNEKEGDMLVVEPAPVSEPSAFNAEEYLPDLAEFDLTEEQANELLVALWEIMKAFVDLGFGVDSIHEFLPALGEVSQEIEACEVESERNVISRKFENSARGCGEKEEES